MFTNIYFSDLRGVLSALYALFLQHECIEGTVSAKA